MSARRRSRYFTAVCAHGLGGDLVGAGRGCAAGLEVVVPVEVGPLERVEELLAAADDPELRDHEHVGRQLDDLLVHVGVEARRSRETTPTRVVTPMMMPSRVRKLRSVWARRALSASRNSSPVAMSARPAGRPSPSSSALTQVAGLELAQGRKGPVISVSPPLRPSMTSSDSSPRRPGLERLEARLAASRSGTRLPRRAARPASASRPGLRSISRTTRAWIGSPGPGRGSR